MDGTRGKQDLLRKAELSVWLDTYDDVFSDFDSRPLTERSLSDDFLIEVRKMVREKPTGSIGLKLLMPAKLRNPATEAIIVKNLHTHFSYAAEEVNAERRRTLKNGYLLCTSGFALMICAALITSYEKNFLMNALRIIIEPAGWFTVWAGLEDIFYDRRKRRINLEFNLKMAHAEISFVSY